MDHPQGWDHFVFDMAGPFYRQVADVFDRVENVPLRTDFLESVESRPGVYGLSHQGLLVYVGKADRNVASRLRRHRDRLRGRVGISPDEVEFRCVYLEETWDPFKPEAYLIRKYGTAKGDGWNRRGFGINEPGRQRVGTILKDGHWHVRYPIDPGWECSSIAAGSYSALELVRLVQQETPYWVKVQGVRSSPNPDAEEDDEDARAQLSASTVEVGPSARTVRHLLVQVATSLPDSAAWQLTQIPSHMLLYRETGAEYPRMTKLWPPQTP